MAEVDVPRFIAEQRVKLVEERLSLLSEQAALLDKLSKLSSRLNIVTSQIVDSVSHTRYEPPAIQRYKEVNPTERE